MIPQGFFARRTNLAIRYFGMEDAHGNSITGFSSNSITKFRLDIEGHPFYIERDVNGIYFVDVEDLSVIAAKCPHVTIRPFNLYEDVCDIATQLRQLCK